MAEKRPNIHPAAMPSTRNRKAGLYRGNKRVEKDETGNGSGQKQIPDTRTPSQVNSVAERTRLNREPLLAKRRSDPAANKYVPMFRKYSILLVRTPFCGIVSCSSATSCSR